MKLEYEHAMAKLDNAETTLKLKVEKENKTLVKKYQESKEKNSELVCNYVAMQALSAIINIICK